MIFKTQNKFTYVQSYTLHIYAFYSEYYISCQYWPKHVACVDGSNKTVVADGVHLSGCNMACLDGMNCTKKIMVFVLQEI